MPAAGLPAGAGRRLFHSTVAPSFRPAVTTAVIPGHVPFAFRSTRAAWSASPTIANTVGPHELCPAPRTPSARSHATSAAFRGPRVGAALGRPERLAGPGVELEQRLAERVHVPLRQGRQQPQQHQPAQRVVGRGRAERGERGPLPLAVPVAPRPAASAARPASPDGNSARATSGASPCRVGLAAVHQEAAVVEARRRRRPTARRGR